MTQKRKTALAARLSRMIDQKWETRARAAEDIGISGANLSRYLSGDKVPSTRTLEKFTKALGVSLADLLGVGPKVADQGMFTIPICGWVSAGPPKDAAPTNETIRFHEWFGGEGYYALEVHGDSMTDAGIFDRDVIVVKPTPHADEGEIVVVEVDGEKTVKSFSMAGGKPTLLPFSGGYEPIVLTAADNARIVGVVIGGAWNRRLRRMPPKPPYEKKSKGKK